MPNLEYNPWLKERVEEFKKEVYHELGPGMWTNRLEKTVILYFETIYAEGIEKGFADAILRYRT